LTVVKGRYGDIAYFTLDTGAVSHALAEYGEWAANELTFVRQFIPAEGTVLDVGAYLGTHTIAFARWATRVIAFEAQPTTFRVLHANVCRNGLTNICLECAAVGSRCDSMRVNGIDISIEASFGSTSLEGVDSEAEGTPVDVRVVTIDSLELERCDFIKIDVEGMESAVIAGAAKTILRCRPAIYAECNSVQAGAESFQLMRKLGYEVSLHVVDAFTTDNFYGNSVNIFGQAREAALIGLPTGDPRLRMAEARSCELLVPIETLDDLVLGLLNKPQYLGEILQPSAAARNGADIWLAHYNDLRGLHEHVDAEATELVETTRRARKLQARVETLEAEAVAQRTAAASETSVIEAELAELAAATQRISEFEARMAALVAREVELQGQLHAVCDDLARADGDMRLLRLEVGDQASLAQALAIQVAIEQQASKNSERRADLAERRLAEHAARISNFELELDEARVKHLAIETSTCWRMTGWLRRLIDGFRR
jgi:FkbM family methyltransferase